MHARLEEIICQLGGAYSFVYNKSVTHYVFEGKGSVARVFMVLTLCRCHERLENYAI
jgi:hypothetical protein